MRENESRAWEKAYRNRPRLWAGAAGSLPDPVPGGRVLELGCGNAVTLSALVRMGWEAIALDFSATAVRSAHALLRDTPAGDAVVADAHTIPLVPASVSAVVARHVLGHMTPDDRNEAACEILRVLRPGGMLYFSEFSTEDFRFGQGTKTGEGTYLRGTGISTHYFTEPEVLELFSSLAPVHLETQRWKIRIRGSDVPRAGIHAVFQK